MLRRYRPRFVLGARDPQVDVDVLRPSCMPADLAATWRQLQRRRRAWESPFFSPCWARSVELARGDGSVRVVGERIEYLAGEQ